MRSICLLLCMILAVLCAAYGALVQAVGSGTWFFAVWYGMAVGFALLGVGARMGIWEKIPGSLQKLLLAAVGVGLAFFLVIEGCVISRMHMEGPAGLDYILVLGAQVHKDGPSLSLKYRLDKAAEYLEENPETICIVSGGQGFNEPFPEAEGMAEYLIQVKGIHKTRLILEGESKTTAENVRNSRKFIPEGATVGILTNDFHMFRALQIARSQELENLHGITAKSTKLYLPNNMLREFFAEIKYLIF